MNRLWDAMDAREREAFMQAILETTADGLVVVDAAGVIHSLNRNAETLFGWTTEEARGQSARILMCAAEASADQLCAYSSPAGSRSRVVIGRRKDGAEFSHELRVGQARVGGALYYTAIVRDLSAAQAAEHRTEELRSQLTQVWTLNSLGEMASVLAHELNQPLSAITNYLRAARTMIAALELQDDRLIEAVSRAGDQAVRAGDIIRAMRDLASRAGIERAPESLSGMIREIEFILSLMARDARAAVIYEFAPGDDIVMADRIQIQQLIVNLVRNGIDAMATVADRRLMISTRLRPDGAFVTCVEDSGAGIDPAIADRLFQPLASTKPQGMGLGLSISRAIVENHDGHIWVETGRLGGAAFCFTLLRVEKPKHDVSANSDRVRH
jgi:two-component system sensor kinase FixL